MAGMISVALPAFAQQKQICEKPVFLTFDTGHMDIAPLVADVLKRQQVKVTFFAAQERTRKGDGSLGAYWAPWWRARGAEGHEFASHTLDHVYWRADVAGPEPRFRVRPSAGSHEGEEMILSAKQYCEQISAAARRLKELTGKEPLPLYRAPGGRTSPALLAATRDCGFRHVGWSPAGFLGDELPSAQYGNEELLKKALREIRPGHILMAHLGIWSRIDPWAPAVLEPLIMGLKERGFCFQTMREHPTFKSWVDEHGK